MAVAFRCSASTPKGLVIEAVTPRRLSGLTPKGLSGTASSFYMDLEHTTPRHQTIRTPTSTCHTPKTPSTAAARLLSAAVAASCDLSVLPAASSPAEQPTILPRLLGRPPLAGAASAAAPPAPRSVRFEETVEELAIGARDAFVAMQGRIGSRRRPMDAATNDSSETSAVANSTVVASAEPSPAPVPTYPTAPSDAVASLPRLLGRPPSAGYHEALAAPRCVHFEESAEELAMGAREAFLALQRRLGSRKQVMQGE